jgi:hypothetical protein
LETEGGAKAKAAPHSIPGQGSPLSLRSGKRDAVGELLTAMRISIAVLVLTLPSMNWEDVATTR